MTREIKNRVAVQSVPKQATSKGSAPGQADRAPTQLGKGGAVQKQSKGCC